MSPPVVVELDSVVNDLYGAVLRFEPVPVSALFLKRSDETLNHAVFLRTMRCDELLLEPVAAHEPRVGTVGEHQVIVGAQQQRLLDSTQCAEAGD